MTSYQINSIVSIISILLLFQQFALGQDSLKTGSIQANQFKLNYIIEGKGQPAMIIGSSIYPPLSVKFDITQEPIESQIIIDKC